MTAVESRLAATLAKHEMTARSYGWVCDCGVTVTESPRRFEAIQLHARHVAAVIASDDDLAVISLPVSDESDAGTENENGWREWHTPHGEITVFDDGEIHLNGGTTSADHITRLAAALLAAAKAAEGVTRDEV